MSSEIALLDQSLRSREAAGERRLRWATAVALLFACACSDSEGTASAPPLPNAPPDAGSVAPSSPSASSDAGAPDAGTRELPASPDQPAPGDTPGSEGSGFGVDLNELACSSGSGQQTICLDDENVVLCEGGQPIETSCTTLCAAYGLNPGTCNGGCQCGEPSSPSCALAAEDFCACSALVGSSECTPDMQDRLYFGCFINGIAGELMACTAEFRSTRPDAAVDDAFCADLDEACD